MKAFVIGDVHGCLKELKEILQGIDRSKARVLLCGDLIDRGSDSEGVVDFVRDNNIECVKGNHELMAEETLSLLKDYIQDSNEDSLYLLYESDWFYNGGRDVFNQYKQKDALQKLVTDIEWLSKLPLFIRTGIVDDQGLELLVSHTWTSWRDLEFAKNTESDFVWYRTQPVQKKNKTSFYNIYGHTPVDYINQKKYHRGILRQAEPEWYDGCAAIDTGAAYNTIGRGILTGVFFPSLETKFSIRKV